MQRKTPDKLLMGQANVKKLFEVTKNLKHNTMLKLRYGMGLRVSEIMNIKIKDVDSKNMQVFIAKAKGKKRPLCEFARKYFRAIADLF